MGEVHRRASRFSVRLEKPALRIVPDALWAAAHERLAASRAAYLRSTGGKFWGRPCNGTASRYLLMGLAVCAVCGKSFRARSRPRAGHRWFYYQCQTNLARGRRICSNNWIMPLKEAEAAVLATIEHHLPSPRGDHRGHRGRPRRSPPQRRRLRGRARRSRAPARRHRERAGAARGRGRRRRDETLLTALRERERRREQLRAHLAALDAARHVASLDMGRMRTNLGALLDEWRGLLLGNTVLARQAVRKLVPERLVFAPITTPAGERLFEFRGGGPARPHPRRAW